MKVKVARYSCTTGFNQNFNHFLVSFNCWKSNPNVTAWMKDHNMTDYAKLEEYWVSNVVNITEENNFDYIVWEEVNKNEIFITQGGGYNTSHFS